MNGLNVKYFIYKMGMAVLLLTIFGFVSIVSSREGEGGAAIEYVQDVKGRIASSKGRNRQEECCTEEVQGVGNQLDGKALIRFKGVLLILPPIPKLMQIVMIRIRQYRIRMFGVMQVGYLLVRLRRRIGVRNGGSHLCCYASE